MSVLGLRREGEPLGGAGRNERVVGADGDAQAGLSTRSQVQVTKDDSGHFTTFYCPSDFGISHVRNVQAKLFHLVRMEILATSLHHLHPKCLI